MRRGNRNGGLIHYLAQGTAGLGLMAAIHRAGHVHHGTGLGRLGHTLLAEAAGCQGDEHPDGEYNAVDEE